MKGRATSRTVRRLQVRAALVASFLLLSSTPGWPAERAVPLLLPASVPLYTRNNECTDVKVPMPPSTYSAIGANMISPQPADMPLSQGDSAICFAYATADMISQRVQTEISALDVATKYYLTNPLRLAKLANPDLQLISKEWGTIGQRLPKAGTQQMSRETITRIDTPISISMKGEKKKLLLCCIMLKGSVRTETSPLMTGTHTSQPI
jgi:hypothetical protein